MVLFGVGLCSELGHDLAVDRHIAAIMSSSAPAAKRSRPGRLVFVIFPAYKPFHHRGTEDTKKAERNLAFSVSLW